LASAAALYSGEVLALATALARYPLAGDLPWRGEARSRSCGSTLAIGLALDPAGRIERVGLAARACAIGQAAAAIFAEAAAGRSRAEIAASEAALTAWLAGEGAMPDWPGLEAIAVAAAYPGRHGAMLLPWLAALNALSSGAEAG
jgi:NifU-like protein involved in Fe-S cluster formation